MKAYTRRKPVAMVPLLLIHLLMWRASDADTETKFPNVERSAPDDIILEEVIISGSGNNTRIIANAVAQKPSQLSHEILSLLSKRETHEQRLTSDQHVGESRDATIDVHAEDDEHNLEKLKHVVAKYEPQKITSGIAKRKVVVAPIDIYDTRVTNDGKAAESTTTESTTDLDNTYHEVLRNVSHEIPQLTMNNAGITLSPYPSQEMKNLKQIPTPEATIRTLTDDGTEQPSHSNIDPSYALSALKKKKLLLKKYTQPSYTITASPRASSDEESRLDEFTADINESTISKEHSHVNGNPKLRNEPSTLSSLNVSPDPTGESGNRREWNVEGPSSQVPPSPKSPTVLQSSNHVLNADNSNKKQPHLQTVFNSLHLPLKYNKMPRPFSISVIDPPQLPNAATNTKNVATSYKKPSSSLTDITHQIASTVLPFVLPTEQFSTPLARHYVPIKRGNHDFKSNGIYTTATTFNAKSPGEEIAVSQKPAPFANAIDTTKIPVVAVNSHQSPNYYFVTENPMEQRTVASSFATTYIPSQPPVMRILQRRKEPQDVAHNTEFVSRVASSDDKTNLNANPAIALYNKFAGLYSIPTTDVPNVLHVSQAIAQDYENFKQPSLLAQQASALPYKTRGAISLKPIPPALLKPRPIASVKPLAPYFDYSLLLPQQPGAGKLDIGEGGEKIVGKSEPSRVGDKIEGDTANDKSTLGNYQTQINHGAYKIHEDVRATPNAHEIHETPSKRKQSHNEDPYYQRSRDDEREDEYRRRQDKNDGEDGGSKNVRNENDEDDEENAGETRDGEHKTRENKDENDDNYYRYDKFKYDRDNSEGEQRKQQHNGAERYDGEERPRDKYDRDIGVNRELTDGLRYDENGEEYRSDRYEQQKSARDGRYGEKNRRDREKEEHEDESATELVAGRAEDQRAREQHGKYQKIRNNNGDKRIYYSHLTSPTDSLRQAQQKDEEYGEIKPKHVHEEYQQQKRVKDDYRDLKQEDNGSKGHGNEQEHGETQDHAHKEHHDEKKHGEDHKFEAGDGGEHEEEHHKHEGEKGDKSYKVWHEDEKAAKGHHDKEHSSKEYDEKVGEEKKHNEEGGYHENHNHDEKGGKTAEFGEKGEHKKGHSTKGEHSVHKKDEYEKKTVFFDEFHDDGEMEKHGEHHLEHKLEKGGHEKKAHHDIVDHEEKHGKQQKYEKGSHHHEDDGHKVHEGHDHHYDHDHKYGEKGGHEHGKKWSFKKGDDGGHKHNR